MAIRKVYYSFIKGMQKVSKEDYPLLQNEIYNFLGCSSLQEYYKKRKSYMNIPAHVKEGIESIFSKYNINNPEDIWDINSK